MIEIKDILSRISDTLFKEESKMDFVRTTIENCIKIKINPKDIKVQNHTIYLNLKPIYKNEIFLKKEEISRILEESLIKKIPKNIR